MQNNKEVILKVEHLCQYFKMGPTYELKAVDDFNIELGKGEVFGLVGESGCGKTTTGRTIIKLYDATSGNVYYKGQRIVAGIRSYKDKIKSEKKRVEDEIEKLRQEEKLGDSGAKEKIKTLKHELSKEIATQKENIKLAKIDQKKCDKIYSAKLVSQLKAELQEKREQTSSQEEIEKLEKDYALKIQIAKKERLVNEIQMIFQDPIASLDPRMTVREIIAEGLIIKGIKDKEYIDERVCEALEKVGLVREHANRYPHEFSGGQRQRIGVARSVIMNPSVIIADEPVSALDVSIQAQVINLLNEVRNELGLTIMFIAHDLSVIKYFSDRIGVMYFGKLVELATSDELFAHPLHPYTRSLLSAIPLPDPVYEKKRKRIVYNPIAEHDYSKEQPSMREITEGHFIMCNTEEFNKYKKQLEAEKK